MQHQYIFINGPRLSGKDTAANFITKEYVIEARHMKFAGVLKNAARAMFCVSEELWSKLERVGHAYEKTAPRDEFFGMSWVEVLMWLSEVCMKEKFGNDIFGRLLGRQLQQATGCILTVVSDCGFAPEVAAASAVVGAKNCHVFQLRREGCDFTGDSRGYVEATDVPAGVSFHLIDNQFERDMFRRQILIRVNKILGGDRKYD